MAGTVLELLGAGVVLGAAWAFEPLLAIAVAGAAMIVAGYVLADPRREPPSKPKG